MFPATEPYDRGLLDVGDGHQAYWECCGNPEGRPALAEQLATRAAQLVMKMLEPNHEDRGRMTCSFRLPGTSRDA